MAATVMAIALVAAVASFALVYLLLRSETSSTTVTDLATAEREAREFGGRETASDRD